MTAPSPSSSDKQPEEFSALQESRAPGRTVATGLRQYAHGWRLFTVLAMAVLGALIGRNYTLIEQSRESAIETASLVNYDAYSSDITSVLYNGEGRIEYTMDAAEQIHYLDDTTLLTNPFVRLYQDSGIRWNIAARSGRILGAADSDNIERLDLSDEVEVFQVDEAGNRIMLTTAFISIYPETETMHTDQEVTMTTNTLYQTAIGMHADLQQDKLTFLSQVRGRYEVASDQP